MSDYVPKMKELNSAWELIPEYCPTSIGIMNVPYMFQRGRPLILPAAYPLVIMSGLFSVFVVTYVQYIAHKARRRLKVPDRLIQSETCMEWNCYHRPFSSTLEIYPQFMFLLFFGGLESPLLTATGGFIWCCGRLTYARHYYLTYYKYKHHEEEFGIVFCRRSGSMWVAGNFMMWVATVWFALRRWSLDSNPEARFI